MQIIEKQIIEYILRHYTVPTPAIQTAHRLRQDLALSDWELFEVLLYLEQRFEVDLPNESITHQLTVSQLIHLIVQGMPQREEAN